MAPTIAGTRPAAPRPGRFPYDGAMSQTSPAMRYFSFEIVVERESEGDSYSAWSPTLPVCFSNGATMEEAPRNMRDAIRQHVESLLTHGESVPQGEKRVHVEELVVGVPE